MTQIQWLQWELKYILGCIFLKHDYTDLIVILHGDCHNIIMINHLGNKLLFSVDGKQILILSIHFQPCPHFKVHLNNYITLHDAFKRYIQIKCLVLKIFISRFKREFLPECFYLFVCFNNVNPITMPWKYWKTVVKKQNCFKKKSNFLKSYAYQLLNQMSCGTFWQALYLLLNESRQTKLVFQNNVFPKSRNCYLQLTLIGKLKIFLQIYWVCYIPEKSWMLAGHSY